MSKEVHHLLDAARDPAGWQRGPVDQDHGQAKRARRVELGLCARSAGILGHNDLDAMGAEKRRVPCLGERAAGNDDFGVRQGQHIPGRVHEAKQVAVLRLGGEGLQVLPADGKEDRCGRIRQRGHRARDVGYMPPIVARSVRPGCAFEGAERHIRRTAGFDGVPTHPGGEGVSGINDMGDAFLPQAAHKTLGSAETADPGRQRLLDWGPGAPGIGEDRVDPRGGERPGELARLGRAAEKKDAGHG